MWFPVSFPSRQRPSQPHSDRRRRSVLPRLERLEDRTVPSTLTVLNNLDKGAGSLRQTIANARDGDTLVFAPGLAGQTIKLTSGALDIRKSLDIEGPGAGLLAVSGNDTSRVFDISAGLTVTIAGLTITHGRGKSVGNGGGGVLNVASSLSVAHVVFSGNEASHKGGAISNVNGGTLTVSDTTFADNQALEADGDPAAGGAIFNGYGSTATLTGCAFTGNRAVGGDGGVLQGNQPFAGQGFGGGIANYAGSVLTVLHSTFTGNQAVGGNGGSGGRSAAAYFVGNGTGGGIDNADSSLVVSGCTFAYNQAVGGSNATGSTSGHGYVGRAVGGAIRNAGVATITNSTFDHNEARGGNGNRGGSGVVEIGLAFGGGIANLVFGSPGQLNASNLTLTNNRAVGGDGNAGGALVGAGIGGGLANFRGGGAVTLSYSTVTNNLAVGGAGGIGGNGGNGLGSGVFNDAGSTLTLMGTTVTGNAATGGSAGAGGSAGLGVGGGVYLTPGGTAYADVLTLIFANDASTTDDNVYGSLILL